MSRQGVSCQKFTVCRYSFDRAFYHLRPVIQGTGDVGVDRLSSGNAQLSETELQGAMDFVFRLFSDKSGAMSSHLDSDVREHLDRLAESSSDSSGVYSVKDILEGVQERMRQLVATAV